MREINTKDIIEAVEALCMKTNCFLNEDVRQAIEAGMEKEQSPVGKEILASLIQNAEIAGKKVVPICQDTGMMILFVQVGQDVHITGGNLEDALNEGVRRGYTKNALRLSVVGDPLRRKNTGDNTPAVIHYSIVEGDKLKITAMPNPFGIAMRKRVCWWRM